ncbi:hypothetical protein RND81_04G047800 [Saponaria officinalis]|uniref:Glycine-rich protein n=1 Tax=Saponaria officinalis TaxID=3572 RepID=A0AAW1LKZ5_SAPOF
MVINHAVFISMLFSFMLLIASSSDENSITGQELMQSIRAGHGSSNGNSGGGGGHGDGNGESTSGTQPGRPLNGAGTANNHNHHRKGAAINGHSCNFNLIGVAISCSLFASLYIWA